MVCASLHIQHADGAELADVGKLFLSEYYASAVASDSVRAGAMLEFERHFDVALDKPA